MRQVLKLSVKKKSAEALGDFYLVHHLEKSFHIIRDEMERWREILEVPYQEYATKHYLP